MNRGFSNKSVERTGMSRSAQWQLQRQWADRLIPVRSTDLFENPRFITQNSPAKISRLATAAGEATAHPIRTRMPRRDTNKSVREIDGHKFPGYRLHLTPVRHQRSPPNELTDRHELTNERETPRQTPGANGGSVQRFVELSRFAAGEAPRGNVLLTWTAASLLDYAGDPRQTRPCCDRWLRHRCS